MGPKRAVRRAGVAVACVVAVADTACIAGSIDRAGTRSATAPTVVTLADASGDLAPQALAFADEVARVSGGTLTVEVRSDWNGGLPDQEAATIDDVKTGRVDVGWVGARALDTRGVTSFQALHAPLLVDSYDLQRRVFDAGVPDRMLLQVETIGLVPIAVLPGPLRRAIGVSRPFLAPADFAGAVVGHAESALTERTVRALGGSPVAVPVHTPLDGLDAIEGHLGGIEMYASRPRYVTANVILSPRPLVVVMNRASFDGLTLAQQDALVAAGANSVAPALARARTDEAEAAGVLCRAGTTVVEAAPTELAGLNAGLAPVQAELARDPLTAAFLDEIRRLKEDAPPADTITCPSAETTPTPDSSRLDGVYTQSTTMDELAAADDEDMGVGLLVINHGDLVLVIDGDRFAFTLENDYVCTWQYGTLALDGDLLEMSFLAGSGPVSNKAGEHFVFEWSLYRDSLTFGPPPRGLSPTNFRVEPWRRTTTTPTIGALSARCPPPGDALG